MNATQNASKPSSKRIVKVAEGKVVNGKSPYTGKVPTQQAKTSSSAAREMAEAAFAAPVKEPVVATAMQTAMASASKAAEKKEAVTELPSSTKENTMTTITQVAQQASNKNAVALPPALFRVEEIAEKLHTSVSYVYAAIAADKPKVYARDGRAFLYAEDYVESLLNRPRRHRNRRVTPIAPHEAAHSAVKYTGRGFVSLAKMVDSKAGEQNGAAPVKSIFERLSDMEAKLERMAALEEEVATLRKLLGL